MEMLFAEYGGYGLLGLVCLACFIIGEEGL